jgi:hypothetical protein
MKDLEFHMAANLFVIFALALCIHMIFVLNYLLPRNPRQRHISTKNVKLRDKTKAPIVVLSVYTMSKSPRCGLPK